MSKIHHMAGNREAGKHVIFIHGLHGDYIRSWASSKNKKYFWPTWLTEDLEDICIWSVQYGAKLAFIVDDDMAFKDQAPNILENILNRDEILGKRIFFIGHSMGGLIIKQMMRLANDQSHREETQRLMSCVTGIAFLGTPHTGSDLSTRLTSLPARILFAFFKVAPSSLTSYLYRNNPELRELNVWYRDWDRLNPLARLILGEGRNTRILGRIVKPDSSDPGLTSRMIMVDKDHGGICKPDDKEDEVYIHIRKFLLASKDSPQKLWLRAHTGNFNSGWSGYGSWTSLNSETGYILDEKIKFSDASLNSDEKVSAQVIINSVRKRLGKAGASIRLVGLSGVGKTRFAQALFEHEIGENPLSQDSVFYTDTALSPNPTPVTLIEKLINSGTSAIVIIDNCAFALHKTLTEQMKKDHGFVSLLTIEYDIREDIPENTDVIMMEAGSGELITELLKSNYPHIGMNSVRKIADFSGGNARIAIALASAIGRGDDISRLKNQELLSRLLNQRYEADARLQKGAEVLSLVYSFQLEDEEGNSEELNCLSQLSGIRYDELLRYAKELKRRGLAQTRSSWMAVLPHSLANWLSQLALENISHAKIAMHINPHATLRMFTSFTRRLGYLSNSVEARSYARSILAPDGLFENYISDLTTLKKSAYNNCFSMISNLAPIVQSETLDFLGRMTKKDSAFCTRENPAFVTITRLLRSLAYESSYFYVSASMLYVFSLSEDKNENNNSVLNILSSLFYEHLSGTHATFEQRMNFIKERIENPRRDISLKLIGSMLKSKNFVSHNSFDFGSCVRDYGYYPRSYQEAEEWFLGALRFTDEIVRMYPDWQLDIVKLLMNNLNGLWNIGIDSVRQTLCDILIKNLHIKTSPTIWNSISQILKWDNEKNILVEKQKLIELKAAASPDTFEKRVELYLFSKEHNIYGLEETAQQGKTTKLAYEVALEKTAELANELLTKPREVINIILSRCFTDSGSDFRMGFFAKRISDKNECKEYIFHRLKEVITEQNASKLNIAFIEGAISGLYCEDSVMIECLLDEYVDSPQTNTIYPALQLSIPLNEKALERIKLHLSKEGQDASLYAAIARGQRHTLLSDDNIVDLLKNLQHCENGFYCVLDILDMRLNHNSSVEYTPSDKIIKYSQDFICLLLCHVSKAKRYDISYHLEMLAKTVFTNASEEQLCLFTKAIFCNYCQDNYSYELHKLIKIVISENITLVLDLVSSNVGKMDNDISQALQYMLYSYPLEESEIDIEKILAWCEKDTDTRFKFIAQILVPYSKIESVYVWTELAKSMLLRCNDVEAVLAEMIEKFRPRMVFNAGAAKMEEMRPLLTELQSSGNADISTAATRILVQFDMDIEYEKKRQRRELSSRQERFE